MISITVDLGVCTIHFTVMASIRAEKTTSALSVTHVIVFRASEVIIDKARFSAAYIEFRVGERISVPISYFIDILLSCSHCTVGLVQSVAWLKIIYIKPVIAAQEPAVR